MIRRMKKGRYLAAALTMAAVLVAGARMTLASGNDNGGPSEPMMGADGMGSMKSMMGEDDMGSAAESGRMEPMIERGMMGSFDEKEPFDLQFIDQMTMHHRLAIKMSEKALEEAKHPELKDLAGKIIAEQSAEIDLMRGYLEEIEAKEGRR